MFRQDHTNPGLGSSFGEEVTQDNKREKKPISRRSDPVVIDGDLPRYRSPFIRKITKVVIKGTVNRELKESILFISNKSRTLKPQHHKIMSEPT